MAAKHQQWWWFLAASQGVLRLLFATLNATPDEGSYSIQYDA